MGLEARTGIGDTGVVAEIAGGTAGTDDPVARGHGCAPHRRKTPGLKTPANHPGLMHACGHDGHMAALLAAAGLLRQRRDRIKGRVRLLFQPGEEGFSGARTMIEHGVLEGVSMAAGLHLFTDFPCGRIGLRSGPLMAATARLFIDITGAPGHAAKPHQARDALLAGATLVTQLQTIVSRRIDPAGGALLHIGTFNAGEGRNIVAGTARLVGSVRWLSPAFGPILEKGITEVVDGVALQSGCRIERRLEQGLPPVINDASVTESVRASAIRIAEASDLFVPDPSMYSDDMAFYLQEIPGCYAYVGAAPADKPACPHHHPRFDICEDALGVAASLLAQIAFDSGWA